MTGTSFPASRRSLTRTNSFLFFFATTAPVCQTRRQPEPCGLAGSVPCHEGLEGRWLPPRAGLPRPQTIPCPASVLIDLQGHTHTRQTPHGRRRTPGRPV